MARSDLINKMLKKTNIFNATGNIIYNKYVLYAVFIAALFDLLYSAVKQDYVYCVVFILVGFLIAFFNKNMTVILTLTMAVSNILRSIMNGTEMKVEGLTDKTETDDDMSDNSAKPKATVSGNTAASSSNVSNNLMESLKEEAFELQEAQQKIIGGFEQIAPHMDKAESLIESIQGTANAIKALPSH